MHPEELLDLVVKATRPIYDLHAAGEIKPSAGDFMQEYAYELHNLRKAVHISDFLPAALYHKVKHAKPHDAHGLDGWRMQELKLLPVRAYEWFGKFFRNILDGKDWPKVLCSRRLNFIDQGEGAKPTDFRGLSIYPVLTRNFDGERTHVHSNFIKKVAPSGICGGIKGMSTHDIVYPVVLDIELAQLTKEPRFGILRDKQKCFDRFLGDINNMIMDEVGASKTFTTALASRGRRAQDWLTIGKAAKRWPAGTNGEPQGLASVVMRCILLFSVLSQRAQRVAPRVYNGTYIDDAQSAVQRQHREQLLLVQKEQPTFDKFSEQRTNWQKTVAWATTNIGRKWLLQHLPEEVTVVKDEKQLGVHMVTTLNGEDPTSKKGSRSRSRTLGKSNCSRGLRKTWLCSLQPKSVADSPMVPHTDST